MKGLATGPAKCAIFRFIACRFVTHVESKTAVYSVCECSRKLETLCDTVYKCDIKYAIPLMSSILLVKHEYYNKMQTTAEEDSRSIQKNTRSQVASRDKGSFQCGV